jgi:hypothetical protein
MKWGTLATPIGKAGRIRFANNIIFAFFLLCRALPISGV